jgi:hypothetical protein
MRKATVVYVTPLQGKSLDGALRSNAGVRHRSNGKQPTMYDAGMLTRCGALLLELRNERPPGGC